MLGFDDGLHISANLFLENTYVFKEQAKKEVFEEPASTSFFHDNFEALMKPQEEIIDEDEDVEQIVLTNLKVSATTQRSQMKGSNLGQTSMANLQNAAREELKRQEQLVKKVPHPTPIAQQPNVEVGGKIDDEDEYGANVGVCTRFLFKEKSCLLTFL